MRRAWVGLVTLALGGLLPAMAVAQGSSPAIPEGVYEGTISVLPKNATMQARDVPLRLEVKGSRVVGTFSYDVQRSPGRHNWMAWHCRLEGAFDASGKLSGSVAGTRHMVSDGAERQSPNAQRTGTFTGQLTDGRLVATGQVTTDESMFGSSTVSHAPLEFAVDLDSGESAPPGPRIGLKAIIHLNPLRPKPGEQVSLWAEVTNGDGKPLQGAQTIWDVGNYGGNVDPRFTWDGKELLVRLTVVYDNNEYKFRRTIPAYDAAAPASGTDAPATPPAPPAAATGGAGWGPAAILGGIVAGVAAGVIGLAGVLLGRARRARLPRAPRLVAPRPPARRRPPARATAPVAPPAPPRPPRRRPNVPPPPLTAPPPPTMTAPPGEAPPGVSPPPQPPGERPPPSAPPVPPAPPGDPGDLTRQTANEAAMQAGLNSLRDRVQQIIEARAKEGYYITNSSLVSKAWNEFPLLSAGRDWLTGYTGGTCGAAADWGGNWLPASEVTKVFGPGAVYDTITIRNARGGGYAGDWINHIANRVILPDGRRYVVDFWEGLSTGQSGPALIPESAWIARWTERCTLPGPRGGVDPMSLTRSGAEAALGDLIRNWGEQEGIRRYLVSARQTATKKGGNPQVFEEAQRTVRSYQREPW